MAALVVIVPALLAGCQERPAYVIDPERSASNYPVEHPYFTVIVHEGDSISKIAARCDTTTAAIADLNDMDDWSDIYPGQVLRVPSRPHDEYNARPHEEVGWVPRPVPRPHYTPVRYDDPRVTPKPRQHHNDAPPPPPPTQTASNTDNSWWSWWMQPGASAQPEDTGSAKFL